jgi:hypothetical protein
MTIDDRLQELKKSVCAWCRSEYDTETGRKVRYLTDAEYALVLSHGICGECAARMRSEVRESIVESNEISL